MNKRIRDIAFHIVKGRNFNPILVFYFVLLRIKKILKIDFIDDEDQNKVIIDIVILTVKKDFDMLESVIKSLKNLIQPINKIYIVSPNDPFLIDLCQKNGYVFIEENSVLGYGKEKNRIIINGEDRSGWIFQQLLKWSGDVFVEKENYFIIDCDTLLINKTSVIEDGKFVFFQNEEWNKSYFEAFQRLFGYKNKNKLSFTSHMMIFNKQKLKILKSEIETKHGCRWDEAYVKAVDLTKHSSISDYDNYAGWMLCNFPNEMKQKPLYNKSLPRKNISEINNIIGKYKNNVKTLSFHGYLK